MLTVRGADLPHHADQISLPGGRPAPGETAEDTALREAVEEIGVDVTGLAIAGRLTPVHIAVSGFNVQPIVALADTAPVFVPAPGEVAEVLEVPLAVLADTLALGIAATTAIFSVVHATFFAPLPYRDADRLVMVWSQREGGGRNPNSPADYLDFKRRRRCSRT